MKQHMTEEQLLELKSESLDKLQKFCNKHNYYVDVREYKMPLLSIGQMIEFLDPKDVNFYHGETGWCLSMQDCDYEDYDELCDALWEAVKDICIMNL